MTIFNIIVFFYKIEIVMSFKESFIKSESEKFYGKIIATEGWATDKQEYVNKKVEGYQKLMGFLRQFL